MSRMSLALDDLASAMRDMEMKISDSEDDEPAITEDDLRDLSIELDFCQKRLDKLELAADQLLTATHDLSQKLAEVVAGLEK